MRFLGLFCLVLGLLSHANKSFASDSNVMMIAKVVQSGTTISQVIFFNSKNVTSIEKCEEEKAHGLQYGWREFNHVFNQKAGAGFSVLYQCVTSDVSMSRWGGRHSRLNKIVYLVDIKAKVATIELMPSYAKCIGKVRAVQGEESRSLFCGSATQKINNPKG